MTTQHFSRGIIFCATQIYAETVAAFGATHGGQDHVFVTTSEFGHGAYATRRFEIGEVIEFGFSSKFLPGNVNGNIWEMVFTWQEGNKDLTANNPSVREYEGFQHWANCQVLPFSFKIIR